MSAVLIGFGIALLVLIVSELLDGDTRPMHHYSKTPAGPARFKAGPNPMSEEQFQRDEPEVKPNEFWRDRKGERCRIWLAFDYPAPRAKAWETVLQLIRFAEELGFEPKNYCEDPPQWCGIYPYQEDRERAQEVHPSEPLPREG